MTLQTTAVGFVTLKGGVPNIEADLARSLFREAHHHNADSPSPAPAAVSGVVPLIVPLAEVVDLARACVVTRRRLGIELGFAPTPVRPNGVAAVARLAPNGRPYPAGAVPSQLEGSYPVRTTADTPVVPANVASPGAASMGATVYAIPQNPFQFGPSGVAPAADSGLSVESEGGRAVLGPQQWATAIAATQPEFALPPCDLPAVRDVMIVSSQSTAAAAAASGFLQHDAATADDAAASAQQQRQSRHLPKRVATSNLRNRVWCESVLAAYCKSVTPSTALLSAPSEAEVQALSEPITLAGDGREPTAAPVNSAAQKMDEELAKRVTKMRAACSITVADRSATTATTTTGAASSPQPAASLSNGSTNAKKAARAAAAGAAATTAAVTLTCAETGAFTSQLIYPLGAEWSLPPPSTQPTTTSSHGSASEASSVTTLQPVLRHWNLWSKLATTTAGSATTRSSRVVAITGLGAGESVAQLEAYLMALRDAVIRAEEGTAAVGAPPLTALIGPVNELAHAQVVRRVFASHPALFAHVILYSTLPCDLAAQGAGLVAPNANVTKAAPPPRVAGHRRERDTDGAPAEATTAAFGISNFWDAAYAKNHGLKLETLAGGSAASSSTSSSKMLFDFCHGAGSGRQSGGYLHHLLRVHEMNGEILLALHNWRCWTRQLLLASS